MGVREMLLGRVTDQVENRNRVYVFHANAACCPQCRMMDGRVVTVAVPSLISHPHCKCLITEEYR